MALDKLVDSTQLDADLTSVADAIRAKSGGSASLAFPEEFVDAIDAIETGGGGITISEMASGAKPSGVLDITGLTMIEYAFYGRTQITRVVGSAVFVGYIFFRCTGIETINVVATQASGSNFFTNCTGLKKAVYASPTTQLGFAKFNGCSNLEVVDLTNSFIGTNDFYSCNKLSTIILRNSNITVLTAAGQLNISHFKSGGSGGTIYIPKALYDHLGDGSSLDYKAATNWSTVDGYGTITWSQIEGSIYETQYADGTAIT